MNRHLKWFLAAAAVLTATGRREHSMSHNPLLPAGEQLRIAVAWLAEQPRCDGAAIQEAARRFDLTPAEEEFLLTHFRQPPGPDPASPAG